MLETYYSKDLVEAGCDEAGRGCLAGPVFAAAVILPKDLQHEYIRDSKKLTARQRETARSVIESEALAWAVASVSPEEIDEVNILNASFLAMHRAIEQLTVEPELLLIDGNRFKQCRDYDHRCIVGGDAKFCAIAAASILAKTHRDNYMMEIDLEYPQYQWRKNKGYPTRAHRDAIRNFGASPYHRRSFRLLPQEEQGKLFG